MSKMQNEPQIITTPDLLELAEKARHVLIEYLPEWRRTWGRYDGAWSHLQGEVVTAIWVDKELTPASHVALLKNDSGIRPHFYAQLDLDQMRIMQSDNIELLLKEKETFLKELNTMESWGKEWRGTFRKEAEELEAKELAEYGRLKAKFDK